MKIIDIHTHVYPEKIAQKATDSVLDFYGISDAGMNGTAQMLIQRGAAAGISQFAILAVAVKPEHVCSINDFVLEMKGKYDCFHPFGAIHAQMDGLMDEVARIQSTGMSGIKLHPDFQTFSIDDPRLFPMYEAIQGKLPVVIHMGDRRYDYSHPSRLRRVLEMFPTLEVVAAHFGGYSMYETACKELKNTNCIMDVSSSMAFMEKGEAERYINIYGAERFAFGSDYPVWDPAEEVERFLRLDIRDDQKEQILYKTAERVLRL